MRYSRITSGAPSSPFYSGAMLSAGEALLLAGAKNEEGDAAAVAAVSGSPSSDGGGGDGEDSA